MAALKCLGTAISAALNAFSARTNVTQVRTVIHRWRSVAGLELGVTETAVSTRLERLESRASEAEVVW